VADDDLEALQSCYESTALMLVNSYVAAAVCCAMYDSEVDAATPEPLASMLRQQRTVTLDASPDAVARAVQELFDSVLEAVWHYLQIQEVLLQVADPAGCAHWEALLLVGGIFEAAKPICVSDYRISSAAIAKHLEQFRLYFGSARLGCFRSLGDEWYKRVKSISKARRKLLHRCKIEFVKAEAVLRAERERATPGPGNGGGGVDHSIVEQLQRLNETDRNILAALAEREPQTTDELAKSAVGQTTANSRVKDTLAALVKAMLIEPGRGPKSQGYRLTDRGKHLAKRIGESDVTDT